MTDPAHTFDITTPEGHFDAYIARPPHGRPRPVVVVLHEVFGVNADLRATCDELAQAGFIAICPDLFWRQDRGVDLSVNSTADWKKGVSLYMAYDLDAGVRDVEATVTAARTLAGADGKVGVMGYCLGGLLTYLTAARTRVDAAVAFHGSRTDEFLNESTDIDAPLQMHLAEEDEFIPMQTQQRIIDALHHNPNVVIYSYPGCRHGFSRHGGTHFDATAAQLARSRTVEFLHRHLG
ncbi:MAG TPA: dienelactone hydrolase family protein [Povalibacter sp.]|uniref:dienelactone hydrolase family protein n=1 Tax=Povalibacter sp. TaxID=1962978 RepID=UPI002CC4F05A|nr:dienelactone hydrolase family protein [Povalibacter sp.]HMN47473.1 dienelactone hydrolase family protein [Povalibacter sp.]